MTFLVSTALVVVAVMLMLIGIVTNGGGFFVAAAGACALAIVLLWRKIKTTRERTFVRDVPPVGVPDWDRPLDRKKPSDDDADEQTVISLPDVAIHNYDELVAAEVLPSLDTLSVEQLRNVIARERGGRQRQAIINRAEVLIDLTLGSGVDVMREHTHSPEERASRELRINERAANRKKSPDLGI